MEYDFIKVFNKTDHKILKQCNEIASSHHVKNGGVLYFENCADYSDYIICAIKNNEVIAFLCLKEYEIFKNAIYIEQIATKKGFLRKGLAKKLLDYTIFTFKNKYDRIICNVRKCNTSSNSLFKSSCFKEYNMSTKEYLHLEFKEEQIKNYNAYFLEL